MKKTIIAALISLTIYSCQKPYLETTTIGGIATQSTGCGFLPPPDTTTITLPSTNNNYQDTIDLVWMRGQSNVPGRAIYTDYQWRDLPARNFILNKDTAFVMASHTPSANNWQIMNIATNVSDVGSKVGIQPHIVRWYFEKYKRNLYYYQTAKGGTPIDKFIWSGNTLGLYEHMAQLKKVIADFNAKGTFVNVRGTVWYQGESDGGLHPNNYYQGLNRVKAITDSVVGQSVPFIIVQMSDCQKLTKELKTLQNTQAQWAFDHNAILLPNNPDFISPDGWHLNYAGYQKQAEFIFNKLF